MSVRLHRSTWSARRTGAATISLALLFSGAATVAPSVAMARDTSDACAEPTHDQADARLRPGGQHRSDPNELTAEEVDRRERDFAEGRKVLAQRRAANFAVQQTITIPVIVHVISEDGSRAKGNVPDSMVRAQIDVLNEAYSGGTGGAATGFQFSLNKIHRVTNANWYPIVYQSQTEAAMKAELREGGIGTLNLYTGELNSDYLGWGAFPLRNLSSDDGVVIMHETLPGGSATPFHHGDTATHEIGHWLNLYHTFQGGCEGEGDQVDDTPAEASPAAGCPNDRDTCGSAAGKDPITNFMDYSDDDCMFQFTPQQVRRMVDAWNVYRAG